MTTVEDHKCPGPCSICGEQAADRCEQLTGPCCHRSLSFESCVAASVAKHAAEQAIFDAETAAWKERGRT